VDVAPAYPAFPGPALVAFVQAYGGVDVARALRVRGVGARLSGFLAPYAAVGRSALLATALVGCVERSIRRRTPLGFWRSVVP
jgi:hypothetical protein